jgi:hypothetical protein
MQTAPQRKEGYKMRKIMLWVVTASLVFSGVALATNRSRKSHARHHQHVRIIKLFASTAQFKQLDLGDSGFSLGDEIILADDVLTSQGGAKVGSDGGVCTVVRVDNATTGTGTLQCPVTLSLQGGQLFTVGLVQLVNGALSGTQVVAVSGGTGRYLGAAGELSLQFLSQTETNYTITLIR